MENKHCHAPLSEDKIKKVFSEHGINRTKGKIKILQIISEAKRPISVQEIHTAMKASCDVSTIFRTITQFKDKNIIREVNLEEGFLRYEINLDHHNDHHHHHVLCRLCGEIKNIEECDLQQFEKAISKLGYKLMEHRLEFTGVCSKCYKDL